MYNLKKKKKKSTFLKLKVGVICIHWYCLIFLASMNKKSTDREFLTNN